MVWLPHSEEAALYRRVARRHQWCSCGRAVAVIDGCAHGGGAYFLAIIGVAERGRLVSRWGAPRAGGVVDIVCVTLL
eukprot:11127907-Lingulodinium_polyedra.AAC.1